MVLLAAHRLADFYIDVINATSTRQCAYDDVMFNSSETRVYSCPPDTEGDRVRIRFSAGKIEQLRLCEVQVSGGMWHFKNIDSESSFCHTYGRLWDETYILMFPLRSLYQRNAVWWRALQISCGGSDPTISQ